MKTAIALTTVLLLAVSPLMAQGNGSAIYLDHVDGLVNGNILVGPSNIIFHIYYSNGDGMNGVLANSNGFELSGSDSSVTWSNFNRWLETDIQIWCFDWPWWGPPGCNCVGADTVAFVADDYCWAGIPPGYNGSMLVIRARFSDSSSVGGTVCLDSAWFPPSGTWMWAYGSTVGSFAPTWDGPHCWPIIGSCCLGQRGNVDGDAGDQITISDLVYLVDYMFTGGPAPPCFEEADIDGSGVIDINDLVHLVDFMFTFGFPPADCP